MSTAGRIEGRKAEERGSKGKEGKGKGSRREPIPIAGRAGVYIFLTCYINAPAAGSPAGIQSNYKMQHVRVCI